MTSRPPILLVLTTLLTLPLFTLHAQDRISPENPNWQWLRPWGEMHGLLQCVPNKSELWGQNISPIGDANHDGLIDFIVERDRCDSLLYDSAGNYYMPHELLLIRGERGRIPNITNAVRIGPSEFGSTVRFLCAGDWDADGNVDLSTAVSYNNDTTNGKLGGRILSYLIIWWGNSSGNYSIADTTQLWCEAPGSFNLVTGLSGDIDGDHVDDLSVWGPWGTGFRAGEIVRVPAALLFRGHSKNRWGQGTITGRADWL